MHKAFITVAASLLLCGAGAAALVMSSANAQPSPHRPLMTEDVRGAEIELAANDRPPPRGPRGDRDGPRGPMSAERLQQMCGELYARQTGQLAYLETRLELTAAQRPQFQRWKDVKLASAKRRTDACTQASQSRAAMKDPAERPSPADRMAREETMLKQRLADIQAERPALEALYNGLSPEQKASLGNRRGGAMRGHGMRRGGERQQRGGLFRPRD